ncbi:MAG: serine-rich protein [Caldilineaceae bacterium]|nr:serine-rich protein [Caldilineaceae bacterium]
MLGLANLATAARTALDWAAPPPGAAPAAALPGLVPPGAPADQAVRILQRGLELDDGDRVAYAWWQLLEPATGRIGHRAIVCDELRVLPIESRDDPDILGKAFGALRGLHRADRDAIYIASGRRHPDLIVSQLYGSAGEAGALDDAVDRAREGQAAVLGLMSNYLHSRLEPPAAGLWQSIDDQMRNLPHMLCLAGYPDPRHAKKGLTREGDFGDADDELASQQGEIFLRGLAQLNREFLFCATALAVWRDLIIDTQNRLDRIASEYASRQRGSINASFSAALPIGSALNESLAAGTGAGEGAIESITDSTMESEAQGTTATRSAGTTESAGTGTTETVGSTHSRTTARGLTDGEGTTQTRGIGVSEIDTRGTSESLTDTRGTSESRSQARGQSETQAQSESRSVSQGTTQTQAEGRSVSQSRGTGQTLTQTQSSGTGRGGSEQASQTATQAWARSRTASGTDGVSGSQGWSTTETTSESDGTSGSQGWSDATGGAQTEGSSETTAMSATIGNSQSAGGSAKVAGTGVSGSTARSGTQAAAHSLTESTGESETWSAGESGSEGWSETEGRSESAGASGSRSWTRSDTRGVGETETRGESRALATGRNWTQSDTTAVGQAVSQTQSVAEGQTQTQSMGRTQSATEGQGRTVSQGESETRTDTQAASRTRSDGRGTSESQAASRSQTETASRSWTRSRSQVESSGQAQSHMLGRSATHALATSRSEGSGTSSSHTTGSGQAVAQGTSQNRNVTHMAGFGRGLYGGLVPGGGVGRSWMIEDDTAIRLTTLTRQFANITFGAVKDGGWLATVFLLIEDGTVPAAKGLVSQAFHGSGVPRPVAAHELAGAELEALRPSLMVLRGDRRLVDDPELVPWEGTELLWTRNATLLSSGLMAAYWAPSVFEQSTAITIQEKTPPMAFHTQMVGEAVLGHQISPETDVLTAVPLRLSRERHFHTAFCGDTGYGKSVAAERLVYETTRAWKLKSIVLDFGAGWRKFLRAPGLEGRVEIRQLSPGGVRPLRWNPLQLGRYIEPDLHWRSFCDVFGTVGQLGAKRQIHELRNVLAAVYRTAGVFVDEPFVRGHPEWGLVSDREATALDLAADTDLGDLSRDDRQRVAVLRSRAVGFGTLVNHIDNRIENLKPNDIRRNMLEGIRERLSTFVEGAAEAQYAAGPDAIDITEIVPGDWGVAILEGGAFLDDFSKAFLLAWASFQIYTDTMVQRLQRGRTEPARIQIVFEEANKMLGGTVSSKNEEGGATVAERFEAMWRDSRKYGIWLHLLTQTPSAIPPGIMSSCNNLFVSQLKNAKDRDLITASLHRSEKSLTDEQFRKFISRVPVARAIVKLGYSDVPSEVEPAYIRPWMLEAAEPTDPDIEQRLGRIALGVHA